MEEQVLPLRPVEYHSIADLHTESDGGAHSGAGGLEGSACGRTMLEKSVPEGRTSWYMDPYRSSS